jgi:DNA-binding transcriptional ArsR family regulator
MIQNYVEIRNTLLKRRQYVFEQLQKTEDEIETLQKRATGYEEALNSLKTQITTMESLIQTWGRIPEVEPSDFCGLKQDQKPQGDKFCVGLSASSLDRKPTKLTFKQVLELMRGQAFCVNDVYNFALKLPEPIQYSKDSISTQLSKLKKEGLVEVFAIRDGEGWLYKLKKNAL